MAAEDKKLNQETGNDKAEDQEKEPKTYTEAEIDSIVDSKISKLRIKWEKERADEKKRESKMKEMDDKERAAYELEQAKAEIEKLKNERALDANRVEALKIMEKRNVPASLVGFIVTADQDETMENIKLFQREIEAMVNKLLKEKFPGGVPKSGGTPKEVSFEDFRKMTIPQMKELKATNPDLYKKFMEQY